MEVFGELDFGRGALARVVGGKVVMEGGGELVALRREKGREGGGSKREECSIFRGLVTS